MKHFLFFSGSSLSDSLNGRLAIAASEVASALYDDTATFEVIDLPARELPQFSPELAEGGLPARVTAFRDAFASADGIFMSSDEYTGTYSQIFRNAAKWLAHDCDGRGNLLADKKVALCSAMPGGVGGLRGHPALHQLLVQLGTDVRAQRLQMGATPTPFDQKRQLLPKFKDQLLTGSMGWLIGAA